MAMTTTENRTGIETHYQVNSYKGRLFVECEIRFDPDSVSGEQILETLSDRARVIPRAELGSIEAGVDAIQEWEAGDVALHDEYDAKWRQVQDAEPEQELRLACLAPVPGYDELRGVEALMQKG